MPSRTTALPRTSGILTFMRAPFGTLDDLREGTVAIVGVNYDQSSTARIGSRFAPYILREASLSYTDLFEGGEVVDSHSGRRVRYSGGNLLDLGDLDVFPVHAAKNERALRQQSYEIARRGATAVFLGGDHFITYPLVLGYQDAVRERGGGSIGYIQLSSQLDLGDEDPIFGKVWRGATAKSILDSGAVAPKNMVWVGVHGYVPQPQLALIDEFDLKVFTLADVRRDGIENVARRAVELAGEGCDAIYVSVDCNSVDGVYAPGVDAPSFRGLRNVDLLKVADILATSNPGALDLVGCNPMIEHANRGKTGEHVGVGLILRFIAPRMMDMA